MPHDKFFS